MLRTLTIISTSILISTSAVAASIDTNNSTIKWKASKVTGASHHGEISLKKSSLKINGGNIQNATIVFDMNSFTVTDLQGEWRDKLTGHLKSPDFFNVAKHPTATLRLNSIQGSTAKGELTIMGKTQPISIKAKRNGKKYEGKVSFDRTKFGIVYGSGQFFKNLGDKMINDQVDIEFSVTVRN